MATAALDCTGSFVRQRMLGSDAVYELLDDGEELVTCEVVSAPGLEPGTRVRLLRSAVRAMAQLDASALMMPMRRSAAESFARAGVAAPSSQRG